MKISLIQSILLLNFVKAKNIIISTKNTIENTIEKTIENTEKITIGNFNAIIIEDSKIDIKEIEKLPFVEEFIIDKPNSVQIFYQWGLDRINQCCLPLSKKDPNFMFTGKNVDIYVLDTGVKSTHQQFEKQRVKIGYNPSNKNTKTEDKNGHGTHVSSTIIGNTLGIAREANVIPVKVLDDNGSGSWTNVLRGIEWAVNQHKQNKRCSIISMSIGGPKNKVINKAIDEAYKQGVFISVAAGNYYDNACKYSPGSATKAFTVGATTIQDYMSSFSNYGKCVNMFAPGSSILGAWIESNTDTKILSGTSMACPHVSGTVALIMEQIGCSSLEKVEEKLLNLATKDKIFKTPPKTINSIVQVPKISGPTTNPTRKPCLVRCRKRKNIQECLSYEGCGCSWVDGKCRQVCEPV